MSPLPAVDKVPALAIRLAIRTKGPHKVSSARDPLVMARPHQHTKAPLDQGRGGLHRWIALQSGTGARMPGMVPEHPSERSKALDVNHSVRLALTFTEIYLSTASRRPQRNVLHRALNVNNIGNDTERHKQPNGQC